MKPQEKLAAIFLLALACNTAMAQSSVNSLNESPREKVFFEVKAFPKTAVFMANVSETDSAMKFKVWIANPEEAKVTISIRSAEGYLFNKRLSDAWYSQIYDFNNLEDGVYTFEITNRKNVFEKLYSSPQIPVL